MNSPRPRSAVRYYNARVFVIGQALSNIGTFSQIVALSLLVLDLTGSGVALGAVMAVQTLPMLVLAAPAGSLLDRTRLRRLLFFTALAGSAQAACLAVLVFTGHISLPWVFGLALALGCIQAFDRPAAQTFIRELVPTGSIPSAVGLLSATQSIGRLAGPAVAAVLYASSGPASVFATNAVSFAAVLAALLVMRGRELFPRPRHSGQPTGMATAVRFALGSPTLGSVLVGNACPDGARHRVPHGALPP